MRSTTPSALIQSTGLPQQPPSTLIYNHPALSPSSGGISAPAMIPPSSGGLSSSQLATATNAQPPYTIGMKIIPHIFFCYISTRNITLCKPRVSNIGGGTNVHQQHSYSPSLTSMIHATPGAGSGYMVPPYLPSMVSSHQMAGNSAQYGVSGTNHLHQSRVST